MSDVVIALNPVSSIAVAPQQTPGVAVIIQGGVTAIPAQSAVTFPVTNPSNAGGPLGGLQMITIDDTGLPVYADSTIAEHQRLAIGMARTAIAPGVTVQVVQAGIIRDPSWNWTPGALLFLGGNGMPVYYGNLPSNRRFDRIVGHVVDAKTIMLNVSPLSISKG